MAPTYPSPARWIEIAAAGIYERTDRAWSDALAPERQRCREDAHSAIEALLQAIPMPTTCPPASPKRSPAQEGGRQQQQVRSRR